MGLETVSPDADIESADWIKTTWDLPPYKSPEFLESHPDLDAFRALPVYKHAVDAGLIHDDEWVGDHAEDVPVEPVFTPVAAGIVYLLYNDAVLLLKRAGWAKDHPGTWGFPAGGIEDGETSEDAALREFTEETGGTCRDCTHLVDMDVGETSITLYVVTGPRFEVKLNGEHTLYMWARREALPSPLHPGVLEALELTSQLD